MEIDKEKSDLIEIALGTIDLAAEKIAKMAISNKGRSKKPEEERLKEVTELREIKIMTLLIKKVLGIITEEEFGKLMKVIRQR